MFKEYNQNQILLFPPDISKMVREDHIARIINEVVDRVDISPITRQYSNSGQNAYHPRMLLKILFYAYATGIRSSRKIAKKLEEDVVYMWLSGMQKPDFRTIALFRSKRLNQIKAIFVEIVNLCVEMGITKIGRVFIDGTKIEANASGHKMIYLKSLKRREEKIEKEIKKILEEAREIDEEEDKKYGTKRGDELPSSLRRKEHRLKKLKEAAERIREQKEYLKQRSNCSKTDKDANLMRMKRDYIYPGYNVQLVTNNQVILQYEASNQCNDTALLKPQIEGIKEAYKEKPKEVIGDSGYGTEFNYRYLEKEKIEGIIPYQALEKEKSKAYQNNPYSRDKFTYDKKKKRMRCPGGYLMRPDGIQRDKKTGAIIRKFKGTRCKSCVGAIVCTGGYTRCYEYKPWWEKTKKKIRDKMSLEEIKRIYKQRKMEVEAVIGNIKHNLSFRKFLLRGLKKVNIEIGLIAIVHNLIKIFKFKQGLMYCGP